MIILHHSPQTRSMRTLWLLNELGVDFQVVTYAFDKSLRAPEFLAKSPAGRVPALELDGEVYFETGAIAEILCERFPDAGLGRLADDPDRPDWLIWLHFAETVTQHAANLTQQHVALYDPGMRSPIITKLEAARLKKCYAAIEGRLSTPVENRDYLLTSGFSCADIQVGQAVYQAQFFATLDDFPETQKWFARLVERPGFQAALPAPGQGIYTQDFYPPLEV